MFKPKSEFTRNILTLMTGTTIAQAIPIAISPILTRLYTPEDFGIFALFFSLTMIFGSIVNARYEMAIMLPVKDDEALNIAALGILIAIVLSVILFILVFFFNQVIVKLLNNKDIEIWLYLLPLSVLLIGIFNILSYLNTRMKYYKDISKALIYKSVVITSVQLLVGYIYQGVSGLISGLILSNFFGNIKLFKNILLQHNFFTSISIQKIIIVAVRYSNFPKFSVWSALASSSSQHLVSILIASFYSIASLGYYSLSEKVLGSPSAIIGRSIGQVYYQQGSQEKLSTGKVVNTFKSTLIKLILIGIPFFGILFFIVEDLFVIVFGEHWRIAGQYSKILLPLFLVRFVVSPLTLTAIIYEKNILDLCFQLFLLALIIFLLFFSENINSFLVSISFIISIYYLVYLLILFKISQQESSR